jgi:hypothetical protein
MFRIIDKGLRGAFKWSLEDWEDFVEFLLGQQLDARLCRTEADIAIAADCLSKDIVLSQDSDFFAYNSVDMIWRPVGKQDEIKVLECNKRTVLARIGLSTTKFTALACISSNDCKKNISSLGINTNYKVTKGLTDAGKNNILLVCLAVSRHCGHGQTCHKFFLSLGEGLPFWSAKTGKTLISRPLSSCIPRNPRRLLLQWAHSW